MFKAIRPTSAIISRLRRTVLLSTDVLTGFRPTFSNAAQFSTTIPEYDELTRHTYVRVPKKPKYTADVFLTRTEVDSFILNKLKVSTVSGMAIFMLRSGSISKGTTVNTFLLGYFPKIATRLEEMESLPWTFWQIAGLLNGLKCMRETEEGIQRIVAMAARVTKEALSKGETPTSAQVVLMMLGISRITGKEAEAKLLLGVLAEAVNNTNTRITSKELVMCLGGMVGKMSDVPEAVLLLEAFTAHLVKTKEVLTRKELGFIFYGMFRMKSEEPAVIAFLNAFTAQVERNQEVLDPRTLGEILYGLQNMKSEQPEVRKLLNIILRRRERPDTYSPECVSNAISGLRNFNHGCVEVDALLIILTEMTGICPSFNPKGLASALRGLANMNSDCEEVRMLLRVLGRHPKKCVGEMDTASLGNAIYGLQNLKSDSHEVLDILQGLCRIVETSTGPMTANHVERALYGLQGMSNQVPEVRHLLTALLTKVRASETVFDEMDQPIESPQGLALLLALEGSTA